MNEIEWSFEELFIERNYWVPTMGFSCDTDHIEVGLTLNSITPNDIS